jgi:hypothetical protein
MILSILLSARRVHESGILALQIDESVVMKLMMSSSKKGMRGLYIERENRCSGLYYNRFPTTSSLWHKWSNRLACLFMYRYRYVEDHLH